MKKRILGLDTGTNSLGWAVVDRKDDGTYSLVDKGCLIFQEGVGYDDKGREMSKAAERTAHRALRKQYFRRRLRKIEVLKVLVKYNLCPSLSEEELQLWHNKKTYPKNDDFMLWQRTSDNENKNPYFYRHICLHEELDLDNEADRFVLGRSFYHLAQRRGFLSNRLDGSEEGEESGAVKQGISDLSAEMEKAGCEYLGDYFFKLYYDKSQRIRTHYTDREQHYKKEFYAICEKQNLPENMIEELERALYFQRPLKSQRKGVGKCTMERGKPRCAESHPDYEEYRMWSFINNIKVQGPHDIELRPLNENEIKTILPKFYRKSKPNFDFEDLAKEIAGKGKYQYIKEEGDKPYKFNYRMTQSASGCPTIAQLMDVFGNDWKASVSESYLLNTKKDGSLKSVEDMVNDVWNVLYSFSSSDKLKEFATEKLQLNEEQAEKFAKIKLAKGFASLSLLAVRKILPFLRMGIIYPHAVMLANIPSIIGKATWERDMEWILGELMPLMSNFNPKETGLEGTLDFCIKDFLRNNYELTSGAADRLYHPSMVETYKDATIVGGVYQLGSPRINAIRNPMAMRSLHQVRKVVNQLLQKGIIDNTTEVHIEYARELNDANMRKAISNANRQQEKVRKEAAEKIATLYKEATGKEITPTADDILKYQLWEEQDHICLYTGNEIGIADFIGANPKYDIEHTIPRSRGGDFTKENLTLCQSRFNREVKKAQIPSELNKHEEILERIAGWKKKVDSLTWQIDKNRKESRLCPTKQLKDAKIQARHKLELERNYWQRKYGRFTMTEVPKGFARRQGAGIGIISKYAGLFLSTLFKDDTDRRKKYVYTVKGAATAEFRKMWGIQSEFEKKSRDNHIHHCIDAITIACIGTGEYQKIAEYYRDYEEYERGNAAKPTFPKPWPTFTEDINNLERQMLVVHSTPDNMPKRARKRIITSKGEFIAQGDSARGSLHNDTYYGAIERDGAIRYVVRRAIESFESAKDLDNIVDEAVRNAILKQVEGKTFKEAIKQPIYMNEAKGILIKRVRCYANSVKKPLDIRSQRDSSRKEYKQKYYVANDGNYMMVVYEIVKNGKVKREFEVISNYKAARHFNGHECDESSMLNSKDKVKLKYIFKQGTQVILLDSEDEHVNVSDQKALKDRLYYVTTIEGDGRLLLKHHQEARISTELSNLKTSEPFSKENKDYRPVIRIRQSKLLALVEGLDFTINEIGTIKLL